MIRGYREHFAESNIQTQLSRKLFQVTYTLFPYHHIYIIEILRGLKNSNYSLEGQIKLNFAIVYYAPREEKTWTVHISCKLPPEPKARVANTSCWLANFIPVVRILFFAIPGPKTPHSRFGAERECGTFGQGMAKSIFFNS